MSRKTQQRRSEQTEEVPTMDTYEFPSKSNQIYFLFDLARQALSIHLNRSQPTKPIWSVRRLRTYLTFVSNGLSKISIHKCKNDLLSILTINRLHLGTNVETWFKAKNFLRTIFKKNSGHFVSIPKASHHQPTILTRHSISLYVRPTSPLLNFKFIFVLSSISRILK